MATITIIGTGLIGCSMGMALRHVGHFVIGCDSNQRHLDMAKQMGALDATCQSVIGAIERTLVVILAIPVDKIQEILPEILDNLPKGGTVIDTGSTKMSICNAIQNHKRRSAFVASHPMAGREQSGPMASKADLFVNKRVAICESELSSEESLKTANEIFGSIGLHTIYLTPHEHDLKVGLVSHLPQLIAFAFAGMQEFDLPKNHNWEEMASSGFDSATRLAASHPDIWLPIIIQNKEFAIEALRSFGRNIDLLADSLNDQNTESLRNIMEQAMKTRNKFDLDKKCISEKIDLIPLTK